MNMEIKLTTCIMSGQVVIKYIKLQTILLYNIVFTFLLQSFMLKFRPTDVGARATLLFYILNLSKI